MEVEKSKNERKLEKKQRGRRDGRIYLSKGLSCPQNSQLGTCCLNNLRVVDYLVVSWGMCFGSSINHRTSGQKKSHGAEFPSLFLQSKARSRAPSSLLVAKTQNGVMVVHDTKRTDTKIYSVQGDQLQSTQYGVCQGTCTGTCIYIFCREN